MDKTTDVRSSQYPLTEMTSGLVYGRPPTGTDYFMLGNQMAGAGAVKAHGRFVAAGENQAMIIYISGYNQDPNHGPGHDPGTWFTAKINGVNLDCAQYIVEQASRSPQWENAGVITTMKVKKGLFSNSIEKYNPNCPAYKLGWTALLIPMGKPGDIVDISLVQSDCTASAHLGALAFDAQISTMEILQEGKLTCTSSNGVSLTAPGGGHTYRWSNGKPDQEITVAKGGTYTVEITSMKNCTITLSVEVEELNDSLNIPSSSVEVMGKLSCETGNEPVRILAAANPNGHSWSTGAGTQEILVTEAGEYVVVYLGAPGREACNVSQSVVITSDYDLPTPEFSLTKQHICAGEYVGVEAAKLDKDLRKKVKVEWDLGVAGNLTNGRTPIYERGGTYTITERYVRGFCTSEAMHVLMVHDPPRPSVSIGVICDTTKTFRFATNADQYSKMDWSLVDSTKAALFTSHNAVELSRDVIELATYSIPMWAVDQYGCQGGDTAVFKAPHDPVELVSDPEQTGTANEYRYSLKDSSQYVAQRNYTVTGGDLSYDAEGIAIEWTFPEAGAFEMELVLNGVELTCPVTVTIPLLVRKHLRAEFGFGAPPPLPKLPHTKVFQCDPSTTK